MKKIELCPQDLSDKAYEAYCNSSYTIGQEDGKYTLFSNERMGSRDIVCELSDMDDINRFFEGEYDECFADDEDEE